MGKKGILLLISLALIVTLFSGCSKTVKDKQSETTAKISETVAEETKKKPVVNRFGWEVPEKTLEFKFWHCYGPGTNDPDNTAHVLIGELLKKEFNVVVTRGLTNMDQVEKLNLMLAAGDYPEVITYMPAAEAEKWIKQGKAIELTDLVEKYGKNIKEQMGEYLKYYKNDDGKLYMLPFKQHTKNSIIAPLHVASIRYDWHKEIGEPPFTTPEEYYDVLKKIVEKHPKNANGDKVYAMSWSPTCTFEALFGVWGLKEGYDVSPDGKYTHWVNTEKALEALLWMNTIYREGMLDPDAFINKHPDWKAKMSNHRLAGQFGPWWIGWNGGHEVWQKDNPNWKEDMRMVEYPLKAKGVEKATINPISYISQQRVIITDKCDKNKLVDLFRFIDFQSSPLGAKLMGWGVPDREDSYWFLNNDGTWKFNEPMANKLKTGTWDVNHTIGKLGHNFVVLCMPHWTNDGYAEHPGNIFLKENKWNKWRIEKPAETLYEGTDFAAVKFPAGENITVLRQTIIDEQKSGAVKVIMSKTQEEAKNAYYKLRENLARLKVGDLEKYYEEQVKKIKGKN